MVGDVCKFKPSGKQHALGVIVESRRFNNLVVQLVEWHPSINPDLESVYLLEKPIHNKKWFAMPTRVYAIQSEDLGDVIQKISIDDVESIKKRMVHPKILKDLHLEMHKLKSKIQLAKLNNEPTMHEEKALDIILRKLGYLETGESFRKEKYSSFREVPSKGFIKVFRG